MLREAVVITTDLNGRDVPSHERIDPPAAPAREPSPMQFCEGCSRLFLVAPSGLGLLLCAWCRGRQQLPAAA